VIQSLLFMSGVNTLFHTWFGSRLPVIMSGSLAFFLPVMSIINDYNDQTFPSEHEVCLFQNENRLQFQFRVSH
jgi:nucleobase transporter 1/2